MKTSRQRSVARKNMQKAAVTETNIVLIVVNSSLNDGGERL
jgi:hypothetical protein